MQRGQRADLAVGPPIAAAERSRDECSPQARRLRDRTCCGRGDDVAVRVDGRIVSHEQAIEILKIVANVTRLLDAKAVPDAELTDEQAAAQIVAILAIWLPPPPDASPASDPDDSADP